MHTFESLVPDYMALVTIIS